MRRRDLALVAVAVCGTAVVFFSGFTPVIAQAVPADVQQAALAGDWQTVWTALGAEETNPRPAELRLIKGHACLALNYNNQSLELFASALNDADRKAWQTWADALVKGLVEKHQDNAIARYFQGDAHARLKEWTAATECFDKAIKLDPGCYLALNARGVVAHAVGNTIMARSFFVKATEAKADFAEAYASRGTLDVYSGAVRFANKQGPEYAYSQAQRHSRDSNFALACLGAGCVHSRRSEYDKAEKYFRAAETNTVTRPFAQKCLIAAELLHYEESVANGKRVGMSIARHAMQIPDVPEFESEDDVWRWALQYAYDQLERLRDLYRRQCQGAAAASNFCKNLLKQIRYWEELIRDVTDPNRKSTSDFSVSERALQLGPNGHLSYGQPFAPPINPAAFIAGIRAGRKAIDRAIAATAPKPPSQQPIKSPGGLDTDMRKVRSSQGGQGGARTAYGLLYSVPTQSARTQSPQPKN